MTIVLMEGDTDNPEQYIIEKGGIVSNFNSDIFNHKDVQGSSTPKFRQDLYKKGLEYPVRTDHKKQLIILI